MNPQRKGCFRLFNLAGVTVLVHWSWFLVAHFEITFRGGTYPSKIWNVAEYLGLFGIVLLHEFGHALACRQVGGKAERIVLWPLGGIAYVVPPPRPGALLWSIAAGPLVNVILVPAKRGSCRAGVRGPAGLAGQGQRENTGCAKPLIRGFANPGPAMICWKCPKCHQVS